MSNAATRIITGIVLVLASCTLSACGGEQVATQGRTLRLALTEYRIDPQNVRAGAGQLTIMVRNDGRRTHNLVVSSHGRNVAKTAPIWPGTTSRLVLRLPAGSYTIASTLLNDRTLGEYGTLTVK